jgi:hypothetical protein
MAMVSGRKEEAPLFWLEEEEDDWVELVLGAEADPELELVELLVLLLEPEPEDEPEPELDPEPDEEPVVAEEPLAAAEALSLRHEVSVPARTLTVPL